MTLQDKPQTSFQPLCIALGALAGVIGALFFETRPWLAGGLFVFALALSLLSLIEGRRRDRRRLLRWMIRRDNAFLYETLVRRIDRAITQALTPQTADERPRPNRGVALFVWNSVPRARNAKDRDALMRSSFSWPMMDASLKIAFFYLFALLLLQWAATNKTLTLGNAVILSQDSIYTRLLSLTPLAAYLFGQTIRNFSETGKRSVFPDILLVLSILACAIGLHDSDENLFKAFLISYIIIAGKISGAATAMSALFAAILLSTESAFFFVVSFGLVGSIGAATHVRRGGLAFTLFAISAFISCAIALSLMAEGFVPGARVLVFAAGLLPITNAAFDYFSYGATLALLRRGLEARRSWATLAYGSLDFCLALAILFGLALFLTAIVAAINAASAVPLLPLETLFADLASPETRGGYAWLYLSLLSTLVPTAVHLVAVLLSAPTWVPRRLKLWIVARIREPESDLTTLAGILVFALLTTGYAYLLAFAAIEAFPWIVENFAVGAMLLLRAVAWTMGVPLPPGAASG